MLDHVTLPETNVAPKMVVSNRNSKGLFSGAMLVSGRVDFHGVVGKRATLPFLQPSGTCTPGGLDLREGL